MKKLDDIPRQDIFRVPDGYFENLPSIIQSRVAAQESRSFNLGLALKFAVPVLLMGAVGLWWWKTPERIENPEQLIASVSSADIAEYLIYQEITPDDFLESIDYDYLQADSLDLSASEILLPDADYSEMLDEFAP